MVSRPLFPYGWMLLLALVAASPAEAGTIHRLLERGEVERAKLLLRRRPNQVRSRDEFGRTPLFIAADQGQVDMVEWLLKQGAETEVRCNACSKKTPLEAVTSWYAQFAQFPEHKAKRDSFRRISVVLLRAGAYYDIRSACNLGDLSRVELLMKEYPESAKDVEAMRAAASHGHAGIVGVLLKNGAECGDAYRGGLAISYFAVHHPKVLELLIHAGADPKFHLNPEGGSAVPGISGGTLLHAAAMIGSDQDGFPSHGVERSRSVESAKLLLGQGVRVDAQNDGGNTALHLAAYYGHAKMVKLLLDNSANPRVVNDDGQTPLAMVTKRIRSSFDADTVAANADLQAVIELLRKHDK